MRHIRPPFSFRKIQHALARFVLFVACLVHSVNILLALQAWRIYELDSVKYQESLVTSLRKELSQSSLAAGNHSIVTHYALRQPSSVDTR